MKAEQEDETFMGPFVVRVGRNGNGVFNCFSSIVKYCRLKLERPIIKMQQSAAVALYTSYANSQRAACFFKENILLEKSLWSKKTFLVHVF